MNDRKPDALVLVATIIHHITDKCAFLYFIEGILIGGIIAAILSIIFMNRGNRYGKKTRNRTRTVNQNILSAIIRPMSRNILFTGTV